MTLIFGVNTEQDLLLREEFEKYEKQFPDRFKIIYTVSQASENSGLRKGHVTKELLQEVLPATASSTNTKVFVCGPPAMESALTGGYGVPGILRELGYKKDQIFKF